MPRRPYKKTKTIPDLVYNNYQVAKLINYVMRDGKKSVAEQVVYKAFEIIKQKKLSPLQVLSTAIDNVAPSHEVKARRVGGASYLVPMDTPTSRKLFLSLNWIIEGANLRSNKEFHSFEEKLAVELMEAYEGKGKAVEKKNQIEKLAETNKAFAHFRW